MRVAIFSDVHGNLTALDAVLERIDEQAPDMTFFAGDLCVFGARPAACVERLRAREISGVFGNTDQWLQDVPLLSDNLEAAERKRRQKLRDAAQWTLAQMREEDRIWLETLYFFRRVSPTANPRDDLFIVHANPDNVDDPIYPPEEMQQTLYGEIRQRDVDLERMLSLRELVAAVLAFGHVHVPNVRRWRNLTLANVSSVSLPQDGDPRAKYALFTWEDEQGWSIEHQYVEYDVEAELEALEQHKPPEWESLGRWLQANSG